MSARLGGLARRWWDGRLGAAGTVLDVVLAPAEAAYRGAVALRERAYDSGAIAIERAGIPVISVGNIAVGGTGKTPFAHWLAEQLLARGARPAILHGGYGSDEPELHRRWWPQIPVVVGRDRVEGARSAQRAGATAAILDDGFQHRRLHRDLDIVLLAAERWPPGRLLPRGPLREPVSALRRAQLLVCVRKTADAASAKAAARSMASSSGVPVVRAQLRADGWRRGDAAAGTGSVIAPAGPVTLVAAVAEPGMFEENARRAGADVADSMIFSDHHVYTDADVRRIAAAGQPVVTTEKDWTKLEGRLEGSRVWLLEQRVMIEDGADLLSAALDRVLA